MKHDTKAVHTDEAFIGLRSKCVRVLWLCILRSGAENKFGPINLCRIEGVHVNEKAATIANLVSFRCELLYMIFQLTPMSLHMCLSFKDQVLVQASLSECT